MICHSVQAERNGALLARGARSRRSGATRQRPTFANSANVGTRHFYLGMPLYRSAIRYERYSRAPPCITYCLVPSLLTSIDSPNDELPVPRNPDVKTKFPFGNLSALPRAPE